MSGDIKDFLPKDWIGREMACQFSCDSDSHVNHRNFLHATNLRHGANGFSSLPKEGMLRVFSPEEIRRLRPGLNPWAVYFVPSIFSGLSILLMIEMFRGVSKGSCVGFSPSSTPISSCGVKWCIEFIQCATVCDYACMLCRHTVIFYAYFVKAIAHSGVPRNFFGGGGAKQIQLRTEVRENGVMGAVAPSHWFHSICKWLKSVFLLGCYGCIFHGTGNLAQLCQNFGISGGGGLNPPNPPRYATDIPLFKDKYVCSWIHCFDWEKWCADSNDNF
jgi:hypothetical protein